MEVLPPRSESASYRISSSADLLTNYQLCDVLEPSKAKDFKALQTEQGASLLFAIGTQGELNALVQSDGATKAGWTVCNLSKAVVSRDYPDGGAQVSHFTVSQSPGNGSRAVHLAMAVVANGESTLYLSFHNSDSDLRWALDSTIAWQRAPFNAVDEAGNPVQPPSMLDIVGLMRGGRSNSSSTSPAADERDR
jgi:hypothetical protein